MSFFLWISRKIDCMFLGISEIASWLEKIRISRNSIHRYYPISSAYLSRLDIIHVCSGCVQSSMAQCPLAHPDDSSHHELLICSASSGQQLQWLCDPRCSWCTWCYFRLYSDKMWVPASCDSSPCFRLPLSVHTARSRWPHPSLHHTRHHGLLRNCEGTLQELCDGNVASYEVRRHQDTPNNLLAALTNVSWSLLVPKSVSLCEYWF